MTNKEKIILVGGGGHCKSCIDVIEAGGRFEIAGIVEVPEKKGTSVLNYPVLWNDSELPGLVSQYRNFLITIGQIGEAPLRIKLFELLMKSGAEFPAIVSPYAIVSPHASVGKGTIIMHHAIINAGAVVGQNCIINSKALIEHDAMVGNHCHVATGAILNGGASVGDESFIGSGSVTKQDAVIQEKSFVKAHSLIK